MSYIEKVLLYITSELNTIKDSLQGPNVSFTTVTCIHLTVVLVN